MAMGERMRMAIDGIKPACLPTRIILCHDPVARHLPLAHGKFARMMVHHHRVRRSLCLPDLTLTSPIPPLG